MSELKIRECRLDGRYDIRDCLGRGSYSEVYVAEDLAAAEGEPRTVVVKALNPYLQGVPDAELERKLVEFFRNEAVALDRVRHPNIISRLGHGTAIDLQDRVFHYLVVEYLPGGDLQALCRRQPLTLADALHYLEQVADGLAHAHDCGVIHRDIKPQNLLLTADRQTVKIADFGVAKLEAAPDGAITRVGTDVYAAPEHHPLMKTGPLDAAARGLRQLTPAADIYSLAKTTYMLLTGEAPRRFSQKPIEDLPAPVADAPWAAHVLRVLRRATRDDPAARHQSVGEFWDELRDAALPKTQLLDEADASGRHFTSPTGARRGAGVISPPPPAPTFGSRVEPRPRGGDRAPRQRIVVPFAGEAPGGGALEAARDGRARPAPAEEVYPAPEDSSYAGARPAGRLKRLIVALLLLAAFAGMLYATHRYVTGRWAGARPSPAGPARNPAVGREFIATTDVNLRGGPARNTPKVGLAEKDSVVRVSEVSGNWYKVTVVEHGRPKEDAGSADEGWVSNMFLKAK